MNRIQELIDEEMPNWQRPNEGTFEWDIDDVERFTAIVAGQLVRECIGLLNEETEKCRQRVNGGENRGRLFCTSNSYDIPAQAALIGGVSIIKKHFGLER